MKTNITRKWLAFLTLTLLTAVGCQSKHIASEPTTPNLPLSYECKLKGKVIKVTDGDTVNILDSANQTHKIRLSGIDAPERKQPYGQRSIWRWFSRVWHGITRHTKKNKPQQNDNYLLRQKQPPKRKSAAFGMTVSR